MLFIYKVANKELKTSEFKVSREGNAPPYIQEAKMLQIVPISDPCIVQRMLMFCCHGNLKYTNMNHTRNLEKAGKVYNAKWMHSLWHSMAGGGGLI